MKNLQLSLKTNWFEMTKARIKLEDYRAITPYWIRRLFSREEGKGDIFDFIEYLKNPSYYKTPFDIYCRKNGFKFKPFTQNTTTLGYPKSTDKERILKLEHKGIEVRAGNPKWGAEPGEICFVIKHGEIIK